jgi:hypothetical protein
MNDREYEELLQKEMKRQYRDLILAKESGQLHHIDANGEVVIVKEHNEPKTV